MLLNYVIIFVILISLGILYQKFLEKKAKTMVDHDDYGEIRKYLLKDKTLDKVTKPILWIHLPHEYNSRDWISFGSRSNTELNQPYLFLTVKSIIKHCEKSFKIIIIDDGSFSKLIPNWEINMDIISDPIKCYFRQLAMAKLIYAYGGINVPISFLCFRDLITMFPRNENMFVCENYNSNISSTNKLFYPDAHFIGAHKENPTLKEFIHFMERTISEDYTNEIRFVGSFDQWCHSKIVKGKMELITGLYVGTKTVDEEPVIVETLLGEDYIHFYSKMYGIWIPDKVILRRRNYEWFARMSPDQIFESHFILAKYFVLALSPDSSHLTVLEPNEEQQPDWVSFWRVPLLNRTLDLYGPKPMYLGNNVQQAIQQ
jgi:hypothetical protein